MSSLSLTKEKTFMCFRPNVRLLVRFLVVGFALFASAVAHSATIPRAPIFRSTYLALECEAFGVIPPTRTPLAIGDINRDGAPDLIIAGDRRYSTLSMRLGDGYGNFGPLLDVGDVPGGVCSVLCADVDRDGKPDLIMGYLGVNQLITKRGNGDGTFGPPIASPTPFEPNALAVGDMNEDGILDVAIGKGFLGWNFGVMVGDGAGHFSLTAQGSMDNVLQMVLADMNKDGHLDLVSCHAGVHFGDGHGGFSSFVPYPNNGTGESVLVRDMDGDGWPDVVRTMGGLGILRIHFGAPGGFDSAKEAVYPGGSGIRAMAIADVDRDGTPDLVASAYRLLVFSIGPNGDLALKNTLPTPDESAPSWMVTADLDEDRWTDVLVVASKGIGVYFGSSDGWGVGPTTLELPSTPGSVADLPGRRLAVLQPNVDSLIIVQAGPSGAMSIASRISIGHKPFTLLRTDLDGDGGADIVVGDSAAVTLLREVSGGSWTRSDSPAVPNMRWLTAGDLDHDGHLDLVTGNDALGLIFVLPGTISGFGPPQQASADIAQGDGACVGDFDQDGNLDLAVGMARSGYKTLVTMAGDGALGFVRRWTQSSLGGVDMTAVDWDQDGVKDIFSTATNFVGGGRNLGGFQFEYAGWGYLSGPDAYLAHGSFADVDMDGLVDGIATVGGRSHAFLYTRTSYDAATWAYGFGPNPLDHVLLTDLTGDGLPDLVATEPATNRLWMAPHVAAPSVAVGGDPNPRLRAGVRFRGSIPSPARVTGTTLYFDHLRAGQVRVDMLDARGRTVRRLFDGKATDSLMGISWDGRDDHGARMTAGVYFARAIQEGDSRPATGKIVVLP